MTDGQVPRRLTVQADLRVEVDGAIGTVSGAGSTIVISTDEPMKFWSAATDSALPGAVGTMSGPRAIGDVADALDAVGLRVEVVGPNGTLVRLGAPADSRLAEMLTGSRSVAFGSPRAVLPPIWSAVRQSSARPLLLGAAGVAAAAVTLAAVRRRRG